MQRILDFCKEHVDYPFLSSSAKWFKYNHDFRADQETGGGCILHVGIRLFGRRVLNAIIRSNVAHATRFSHDVHGQVSINRAKKDMQNFCEK